MSSAAYAVADTVALLRRAIKNLVRYPTTLVVVIGIPVLFLLLFVYVFGHAMDVGVAGVLPAAGQPDLAAGKYVDYVVPGLLIMTAATGSLSTAASTNIDMTEGIIARFRTMAIFRPALVISRVVAAVLQTMVSMAAVLGVALLLGFTSTAGPVRWLAVVGLLTTVALTLTWLGVAFGLAAKTLDAASNAPLPLIMLPFVGSGIVPAASMPGGLRQFAEYQPFTPMIETLRGLLTGAAIGDNAIIAVAWCAGLSALGLSWAMRNFSKDRTC
ncbi:ABC transporter permease [Streptacidiphilus pinicola]|uniref:Transport permease protein n=1 Tax=Streptacidiphilus pinicola TaxID=2219663 RepID=A0A2X0JBX2_9ACTN|nr:ABC transporter permease [Streptacidiphilus pinicola]RAG85068.1 ABC transporter permease [Streptacidiphilus pinicola]